MQRTFSRFLTASVFATAFLFAQGTGTGTHTAPSPATMAQHQVNRLTTLLTLTAAQQASATTIFTTSITADQASRTSMMAARQALKTAITNNDTGGIQQAATTIGNLTAQQTISDSTAQASFLQILTPDQVTKYNSLHSGPGGRGMGGGSPSFRGVR